MGAGAERWVRRVAWPGLMCRSMKQPHLSSLLLLVVTSGCINDMAGVGAELDETADAGPPVVHCTASPVCPDGSEQQLDAPCQSDDPGCETVRLCGSEIVCVFPGLPKPPAPPQPPSEIRPMPDPPNCDAVPSCVDNEVESADPCSDDESACTVRTVCGTTTYCRAEACHCEVYENIGAPCLPFEPRVFGAFAGGDSAAGPNGAAPAVARPLGPSCRPLQGCPPERSACRPSPDYCGVADPVCPIGSRVSGANGGPVTPCAQGEAQCEVSLSCTGYIFCRPASECAAVAECQDGEDLGAVPCGEGERDCRMETGCSDPLFCRPPAECDDAPVCPLNAAGSAVPCAPGEVGCTFISGCGAAEYCRVAGSP